jgi:hypothetical protein
MGPALLLIAQLYCVEEQARPMSADERLRLRQLQSRPVLHGKRPMNPSSESHRWAS